MKRILLTLVGLSSLFCVSAQNNLGSTDDMGRIALAPLVHNEADVPTQARKMLSNKLKQIVTRNGMGSMSSDPRFVITANSQLMTKEVTATTPSFTVVEIITTLYIGDAVTGQLFSTCECELAKGLGKSLDAAYIDAYKRLNPASSQIQQFVETGKAKVVEYYNSQIDFLIAEADAKAKAQDFDGAMKVLAAVPSICKEAHAKAMTRLGEVYQTMIDQEGKWYYDQAASVWRTNKTEQSAKEACAQLVNINPQSAYSAKGNELVAEIEQHYAAIVAEQKAEKEREWQFKQQQYADQQAAEQEARQMNHELAMQQLQSPQAMPITTQMALQEVKDMCYTMPATAAYGAPTSNAPTTLGGMLLDKVASWFK